MSNVTIFPSTFILLLLIKYHDILYCDVVVSLYHPSLMTTNKIQVKKQIERFQRRKKKEMHFLTVNRITSLLPGVE